MTTDAPCGRLAPAATSSSSGRGRPCCARSGATTSATCEPTGNGSRTAITSPGIRRTAMLTAITGSWGGSTTFSMSPGTGWGRWKSSRPWSRTRGSPRQRWSDGRTRSRASPCSPTLCSKASASPPSQPMNWSPRCARGLPRNSARSRSLTRSASSTCCRRRVRARSCAGCCARSHAARRSRRMSRRSRIRRSSPSCAATRRPHCRCRPWLPLRRRRPR